MPKIPSPLGLAVAVLLGLVPTAAGAASAPSSPGMSVGRSLGTSVGTSVGTPPRRPTPVEPQIVVWNAAGDHGIDLMAARPDGTRRVTLYRRPDATTLNLTLSPDGARVAFAAQDHRKRPRLLVVRTSGGRAVDLVARYPRFAGIGAVGWSRDGRRLVFEGFVDRPSAGLFYPSYLFSIRRDGSHLRRLRLLDPGKDNGVVFGDLVWTSRGFLYPAHGTVRLLGRGSSSRVVLRHAYDVRASGDGRWLVFERPDSDGYLSEVWRARVDGTDPRRLSSPSPQANPLETSLDHDGRRVLVTYSPGRTFTFSVAGSASPERFTTTGRSTTFAWN